ncbi:MAG TPA: nicotinamide riboside transporter PnuC [Allosphingosinicella sp.]|jgi:nicotinamide mononucleotide transporter
MNVTERIAAMLGVANVGLIVGRSVWNYPFAIAMVTLYFFVFAEAKLYSDALLQIFFLAINVWGWREWLRSRGAAGEVVVEALTWRARLAWIAATVAGSLLWGYAMMELTDAAAPIPDAFVAGFSIAAQILLAMRRLENWLLWILVDLIAIPLYHSRGLVWTAWLYGFFLCLAVAGFLAWLLAWRRQQRASA